MENILLENEAVTRLGFFLGTLFVLGLLERMAPRLVLSTPKPARWFANLGIVAVDTLTVRFLLPVLPVGFALALQSGRVGTVQLVSRCLTESPSSPGWSSSTSSSMSSTSFFTTCRRCGACTESITRISTSTSPRPSVSTLVEIVLSTGIKLGLVYLFGPPALSVILFEIILCSTAMFSHSNLRLPLGLDGVLRLLIVTPDMHRVHHSVIIREHNSNFGFNLSVWDRLLGTYRSQPEKGHEGMTIGLANFRDPSRLNLLHILALPFTYRHP